MSDILGRDGVHILTYPVILGWDDFENYKDNLHYFRNNLEIREFLDLVSDIIIVQSSRGNRCIGNIPRGDIEFNKAVNSLFDIVSRILSSTIGRRDIILHARRNDINVEIVVGSIKNNLTLAEFRYFLKLKEEEGYHIPMEMNKMMDEFSDVGQNVIFDSFK